MSAKRLVVDSGNRRIVEKKSLMELMADVEHVRKSGELVRLCGVNNALSAMLAEEAGFEGCWLSSFEAHAACRLPDADILSIADYADICDKITDRISIPLLVDGDAGGGSPINTIRMVREFEKNGATGICIEDNQYPKRCSFYDSKKPLETAEFHAVKIRAARDNALSTDFTIMARTEALIAGLGVDEALRRSSVYVDAGADAVLIHHKGNDPKPVLEFADKFKSKWPSVPLVCVPTTYNSVTENELGNAGFSVVIYPNYGIRSAVKAMQETFRLIAEGHTLSAANDTVVPMAEIFRLIGLEDLRANEEKYS